MQMTPNYTYPYLYYSRQWSLKQLGDCLSYISGCMTNKKLRLNAKNTYFIIIGTSRQRSKLTRFLQTPILSHSITLSDTVRNLGVRFDTEFNLQTPILSHSTTLSDIVRNLGVIFDTEFNLQTPILSHSITLSDIVRNLGVIFDTEFSYIGVIRNLDGNR